LEERVMKYSKRDLPKIIGLSAVLLCIVAYIIVSYVRLSGEYRARMAAEEARHRSMHAALQAYTPASSAQATLAVAALISPTPPPTRDPFYPVIAPRRSGAAARSAAISPAQEETPAPLPLVSEGDGLSSTRSRDALHVTGIIVGSPSTAVLRLGEEHYVVHEGDWLDARLRVQSIGSNTVTLRDNERTYRLRLGR
jgi:hypothetical protein